MTSVLAYHKVDDRFELGLTNVRPKSFRKHVDSMVQRGYRLVPDVLPPGAGKTVCLTFDDGYDCFYRNVVPVLQNAGVKAIVFVIADYIGGTNSWTCDFPTSPLSI